MNYIKGIRLSSIPHSEYPFNIPAVRHLNETGGITLEKPVTFLVGIAFTFHRNIVCLWLIYDFRLILGHVEFLVFLLKIKCHTVIPFLKVVVINRIYYCYLV